MRNYLTEQEWAAIEDAIGCTCCASLGAPLADDDDTPSIARLDIEDAEVWYDPATGALVRIPVGARMVAS